MTVAIETTGLSKRFGTRAAVDGVELSVPEGAVYGFLGQNGAGKTTTIRLLLGLLRPSAGTARIFGRDVVRERRQAARAVGSQVETPAHYAHLTGRENLEITRMLLGVPRGEVARVLELVELAQDADRRVGGYSLGMRQRLGVARALLGRPRLLILDEPTNGLDPNGIRDMRRLIGSLPERDGVTILVSSHVLSEVEQVATHLGLMHRGRLMMQGSAAALKAGLARRVRFRVDRPDRLVALLAALNLASTAEAGSWVEVAAAHAGAAADAVPEINFQMVEAGLRVSAIDVREPSLEDLFVGAVAETAAPLPIAA